MPAYTDTTQYPNDRYLGAAASGDPDLGKLQHLPGVWENSSRFDNTGWNMIALPFSAPHESGQDSRDYRVLANRYNEKLILKTADKGVPNRGVLKQIDQNLDQRLIALDYEQTIVQTDSQDHPVSGKAKAGQAAPIHHEPGLWLHMVNHHAEGADLARLGCIPHGNSLLALGTMEEIDPRHMIIPQVNPFPFLVENEQVALNSTMDKYLEPYSAFVAPKNTFFPNGFDLNNLHGLLQHNTPSNIKRAFRYAVSTSVNTGGIVNTPFISDQADTQEMTSTFWIMELDETDDHGDPVMVMQYMQVVMLDFFLKFDRSGFIRWPHISLNTMVRTSKEP